MDFAFFKKPAFKYASAGFALAIVGYGMLCVGRPIAQEFNESFAMKEFREYGVVGTYRKHFFSFFDRIQGLSHLEAENDALKVQIAKLEAEQTIEEATKAERDIASLNSMLEKHVKSQTGSKAARVPQSIGYEMPGHLTSSELYPLALAYFRKQEFVKSATILDHLLTLPDNRRYETAENYLMSGISWYHLKNYNLAHKQINEAKKHSIAKNVIHRQSVLWDALVEKAEGKARSAQLKLLHFIGEYPHSEESSWINGGRSPAREDVGHEGHNLPMREVKEEAKTESDEAQASAKDSTSEPKEEQHESH